MHINTHDLAPGEFGSNLPFEAAHAASEIDDDVADKVQTASPMEMLALVVMMALAIASGAYYLWGR